MVSRATAGTCRMDSVLVGPDSAADSHPCRTHRITSAVRLKIGDLVVAFLSKN